MSLVGPTEDLPALRPPTLLDRLAGAGVGGAIWSTATLLLVPVVAINAGLLYPAVPWEEICGAILLAVSALGWKDRWSRRADEPPPPGTPPMLALTMTIDKRAQYGRDLRKALVLSAPTLLFCLLALGSLFRPGEPLMLKAAMMGVAGLSAVPLISNLGDGARGLARVRVAEEALEQLERGRDAP